jgi:hypothetical protein
MRRNLSWQFPALRFPPAQAELPTRHYFLLSASRFATSFEVKVPEYFTNTPGQPALKRGKGASTNGETPSHSSNRS